MLINGGVVVCKFFKQMQDNVLKWVGVIQGGMLPQ